MKLLFLLFVSSALSLGVYAFLSRVVFKKGGQRKKPLIASVSVLCILLGLIALGVYLSSRQPDLQCGSPHATSSTPPSNLITATDYFNQGNYDYDLGNCRQAISEYSQSIQLNSNYAQAYNNRGYTYMRLRDYKDALPDLDRAISLNPNYTQALMNRGDIHNYYYQIDRQAAIADYKRVLAITGPSGGNSSVCGHLFLAKHNGWTLDAFIDFFTGAFRNCD